MAKIIVVTSGKGGVGKTTSSAAIGTGLALKGYKTVIIDFDIGLRNLDLIMGCERRVVYDFVNVINGEANLNQALIKDKRVEKLFLLPASQTRDKDALTREGVERVLNELKEDFDYIVCDSPAGIEAGAMMAMYFADEAIVTTNPEVSSVRDSDRILGILHSKSKRAEEGLENIKEHLHLKYHNSIAKIHQILASVGISNPTQRARQFPHELSGGMRQRSMIGMSLSANPKLIIADEPTTALDVTIQAQVLDLMKKIQNEKGMSVILITHDMGVVAEMADFVVVMYMGKIVEKASCQMIFNNPKHPYTIKLLESIPKLGRGRNQKLKPISGTTPNFTSLPTGCLFSPRCDFASSKCSNIPKEIEYSDNHFVSCWKYNEEIKEN